MLQKLIIGLCFLVAGFAFGQEDRSIGHKTASVSEPIGSEPLNAERIFNDLQQQLPAELKSKLDSIHTNASNKTIPTDSAIAKRLPSATSFQASPELKSLSRDVQARVEKTMAEIEKEHANRTLLFKEKLSTKR
jgi:hypothetical protein